MSGGDAKRSDSEARISIQGLSEFWDLIREAAADPTKLGSIDELLVYALEVVRTLHVRDKTPDQRARFLDWLRRLRQHGDLEQFFEQPEAFLSRDSRGGSVLGEDLLSRAFEYRLQVLQSGGDPDDVIGLMIDMASALGLHEWTRDRRRALRAILEELGGEAPRAALGVLLRECERLGLVEAARRLQRLSGD